MGSGMRVLTVFVSCLLLTSFQPSVISGRCLLNGEEAAALHELKASLLRSGINPPSSWVEGNDDCCLWEGVGCSNTTVSSSSSTTNTSSKRVVEALHLSGFAPQYIYPYREWHVNLSVFKAFHELRHLDVSRNNIDASLESLDATDLRRLEHLNLSHNYFGRGRGMSATSYWSTSLPSLRILDLNDNEISGPFPIALTRLTELVHLDLSRNSLMMGPLPAEDMTGLRNLVHLDLSFNGFEGQIPASWASLSSLRFLDLSSNWLRGPFPADMTGLRKLEHLDLSFNGFEGGIPASWTALSSLRFLDLSGNKLSGTPLPREDLTGPRKLEHLDLRGNRFEGRIPASWTSLSSLRYLDLSDNKLSGPLPSEDLTGLKKLEYLDLRGNQIEGGIPASWTALSSLQYLDLSDNILSGPLLGEGDAYVDPEVNEDGQGDE